MTVDFRQVLPFTSYAVHEGPMDDLMTDAVWTSLTEALRGERMHPDIYNSRAYRMRVVVVPAVPSKKKGMRFGRV